MGWGDELMAAGAARAWHASSGKRVRILDRAGLVRVHPMWLGLDYIVRPHEAGDFATLRNGPGLRPYIAEKTAERWTWCAYTPTPAEIRFTADEQALVNLAAGCVVIEPTLKHKASPNKHWPGWPALADLLREAGLSVVQLGGAGTRVLPGVTLIQTENFRDACAVLSGARAAVLPEGGLHHAAAAVGTPAVVIFGGYISPRQTGYESQVNFAADGEPCGNRSPCAHCRRAMAAIDPVDVAQSLIVQVEALAA